MMVLVILLVMISGNVFAMTVEEFTPEQLNYYERSKLLYNNTYFSFDTGLRLGKLTQGIDNNNIELENVFETKSIVGKALLSTKINGNLVKEFNISYETSFKDFEEDFTVDYNSPNLEANGSNTIGIDNYSKIDFNLVSNFDIYRKHKNYMLLGLGYQQTNTDILSENGKFSVVETSGSSFEEFYNFYKQSITVNSPYIYLRGYSPMAYDKSGMMFENYLRIMPYNTGESTLTVDNQEYTSDLTGWGVNYVIKMNKQISKNIYAGLKYQYEYQSLESENSNFVDYIDPNSSSNIEETFTDSNHTITASVTIPF